MDNINKDLNFDNRNLVLNDLAIGQIIFMDENQNRETEEGTEVPSEKVRQIKKPNKTRSPVYKFFEWDENLSKWKCITCQ